MPDDFDGFDPDDYDGLTPEEAEAERAERLSDAVAALARSLGWRQVAEVAPW